MIAYIEWLLNGEKLIAIETPVINGVMVLSFCLQLALNPYLCVMRENMALLAELEQSTA
jgi:hypothetical protein